MHPYRPNISAFLSFFTSASISKKKSNALAIALKLTGRKKMVNGVNKALGTCQVGIL